MSMHTTIYSNGVLNSEESESVSVEYTSQAAIPTDLDEFGL